MRSQRLGGQNHRSRRPPPSRLGRTRASLCVLANGNFDSPIHNEPFDTSHLAAGGVVVDTY